MGVIEATTFDLHDSVCLVVPKDGYAAGTRGAVVDAYPDADRYTVELVDRDGDTLDLVECLSRELKLVRRYATS